MHTCALIAEKITCIFPRRLNDMQPDISSVSIYTAPSEEKTDLRDGYDVNIVIINTKKRTCHLNTFCSFG